MRKIHVKSSFLSSVNSILSGVVSKSLLQRAFLYIWKFKMFLYAYYMNGLLKSLPFTQGLQKLS